MNSIFKKLLSLCLLSFFVIVTSYAQESNGQQTTDPLKIFDWKELEDAQTLAAKDGKKVLLYANAQWCTYCKKMEREVFTIKEVQEATSNYFYPVWLDIESDEKLKFRGREMTQSELSRVLRVSGTPAFVFVDSEGEIIAGQPGFIPADVYIPMLEFIGTNTYQEQSFEEFIEK